MESMKGIDAGFHYMETPTLHMHTLKIAVMKYPEETGGYSFEVFRSVLASRLDQLPPFRRRLIDMPFGWGHPAWVEDPDFDLDAHIFRQTAAAPGGQRELCEVISKFASEHFRADRPLWELLVVDGLDAGRVAFVAKLHHSVADGGAALALLQNVLHPEKAIGTNARSPWEPDPIPTRQTLMRVSLARAVKRLRALPQLIARTLLGTFALLRHIRGSDTKTPTPFRTPTTSFNKALTSHRIFATAQLPLDDLKAIRAFHRVTINDVVMALCCGVLRRYLLDRGELPDSPLLVSVPTSLVAKGETHLAGNRVGNLIASLPVELSDPVERLNRIREVMNEAKARQSALGSDLFERWVDFTPPRLYTAIVRWWSGSRMADRVPSPVNLVVSNVPGPRSRERIGRVELDDLYSVGPILEGIGLNITAWSYADKISFSSIACPEHVPDLWQLMDHFPDALRELQATMKAPRDEVSRLSTDTGTARETSLRAASVAPPSAQKISA